MNNADSALHHRVFVTHFVKLFQSAEKFKCLDKILFPKAKIYVVTRISKVKITIEICCKRIKFIIHDSEEVQRYSSDKRVPSSYMKGY